MTSFFEYLVKDGGVLSTALTLLGVVVIIASTFVFSVYIRSVVLMILGIFVGVIIIIIGGKYSKFKKEGN